MRFNLRLTPKQLRKQMLNQPLSKNFRVLIFGLGLFFYRETIAQTSPLLWKDKVLEIGNLTEGDSVSGYFQLQNVSNKFVLLKGLQTTCGCTSTDSVVGRTLFPQATDRLGFRFYSAGQIGHLHKLLVITYENEGQIFSDTLVLHGEVLPKKPTYSALFPYKSDRLFLLTPLVVFGNVSNQKKVKAKITLGLEGLKKEKIQLVYLPKGFRLKSKWIKENEVNVIWMEINVRKLKNTGFVEIPFLLKGKKTEASFDMKINYYFENNP